MRLVVAAVLFVGCYSPSPHAGAPCPDGVCPSPLVCSQATMTCEHENTPLDGSLDDASDDAPAMTTADARQCFGTGLGTFCLTALPTGNLAFASDTTINTDTSTMCVAYTGTGVGSYCVIAGTNVSIGAHVTAIGAKPLVVIGVSNVMVSGTLDVASHRLGPVRGAGGNATACVAGDAAGNGQGGPGGSFGGAGGQGGNGEQGGTKPAAGATATTPTTLRGGCRGGDGSVGAGGNGGGAVSVIAGSSIAITGTINASGAAGARSATNEEGGGGGGSGGMIALEAPSITGAGQIFANGGGAGPGNDASNNAQEPIAALTAAAGGSDDDDSGDGGDGSAGATLAGGSGGTGGDGGGGGGGGAGVIRVFPTQSVSLTVSPPAT